MTMAAAEPREGLARIEAGRRNCGVAQLRNSRSWAPTAVFHTPGRLYRSERPPLVPAREQGDEGRTRKWHTRFLVSLGRAERGRHRAPPQVEPSRRCGTYGRKPRRTCAPSRRLGGRGPLRQRNTARPWSGCRDDCACGRVRPGADSHHRPRAYLRAATHRQVGARGRG